MLEEKFLPASFCGVHVYLDSWLNMDARVHVHTYVCLHATLEVLYATQPTISEIFS